MSIGDLNELYRRNPHPSRGRQLNKAFIIAISLLKTQPAPLTGTATWYDFRWYGRRPSDATRTPHGDGNLNIRNLITKIRHDATRTPHGDGNPSAASFSSWILEGRNPHPSRGRSSNANSRRMKIRRQLASGSSIFLHFFPFALNSSYFLPILL